MILKEIAAQVGLELFTPPSTNNLLQEITQGFSSDLLSNVLAHAPVGGLLITVQTHMNVIAVASHTQLAAIVFADGRRPEPAVFQKAEEEKIVLFGSIETAFNLVGKLYALGLRGPAE